MRLNYQYSDRPAGKSCYLFFVGIFVEVLMVKLQIKLSREEFVEKFMNDSADKKQRKRDAEMVPILYQRDKNIKYERYYCRHYPNRRIP